MRTATGPFACPRTSRTSRLAQLATTLNQALDAQQEAEQRLRSFVADASHELRTPLTIATGWIELDGQGGLTDQDRRDHAMERVQVQLGRMRILIDELALLARLDRERPLTLEDVDLTALTNEVVDDARLMNPDRTFTVHAPGPAALRGGRPAAAAGAGQPGRQRGQAHAGRDAGRGDGDARVADGTAPRRGRHAYRARHRPRAGHPGSGAAPRLRTVLARRHQP